MGFLTDRLYDVGPGAEVTPIDDPRRQVPDPDGYSPAATVSPLNFGLGERWRNLQNFARDNPAAMMNLGAGIMSDDTTGGLAQFGKYAQAAQGRQLHSQRQNKTLDFLRTNHPNLADMVDAGLPVAEAWQQVLAGRRPAGQGVLPPDDRAHQLEPSEWERGHDGLPKRESLRARVHGDRSAPFRLMDSEPLDAELPRQPNTEVRPVFGAEGGERLHQPLTQEDFDILPAAALYLDPGDGEVYRKP